MGGEGDISVRSVGFLAEDADVLESSFAAFSLFEVGGILGYAGQEPDGRGLGAVGGGSSDEFDEFALDGACFIAVVDEEDSAVEAVSPGEEGFVDEACICSGVLFGSAEELLDRVEDDEFRLVVGDDFFEGSGRF